MHPMCIIIITFDNSSVLLKSKLDGIKSDIFTAEGNLAYSVL